MRRVSHADIAGNDIDDNTRSGIEVRENSGVDLGTDTTLTPPFDDDTNTGFNSRNGIRCRVNSYASGNIGTLTGASGAQSFSGDCIDNVDP